MANYQKNIRRNGKQRIENRKNTKVTNDQSLFHFPFSPSPNYAVELINTLLIREGNMRRWALLIGSFLVFIGLVSLVDVIWNIDLSKYFWPLVLIALGILMLVRPPMPWWRWNHSSRFVTETNRSGEWYAKDETINGFVGDTTFDFSQTILPDGETRYKLNGFVGDINIKTNDSVGIKVRGNCFVSDIKIFGEINSGVMAPVEGQTKNYDSAPKKVVIDVNYFVADVKVTPA
jgi:predicted membrane protein